MKPMVRIITGNQVVNREMTDAEYTQYQADQAEATVRKTAEARAEAERLAQRQVVLDRLGVTVDELKVLLGG